MSSPDPRVSAELPQGQVDATRKAPRRPGFGVLTGLVVLCVVCAAAGGVAMQALRPASVQATAATSITVTVPVQRGKLVQTLVTRARLSFADSTVITSRDPEAVVTDVAVTAGQSVGEGSRVMDIGERPVIVLQGVVPMYRDLVVGDEGKDVAQLNAALAHLGFLAGGDDTFTTDTAAALAGLYRSLGYSAAPPPQERQEAVEAASAAVQLAADELAAARAGVTQADVLQAELALAQAQSQAAALAEAEAAARAEAEAEAAAREEVVEQTGAEVSATTSGLTKAEADLSVALAQQQLDDARHPPLIGTLQARLADAKAALAAAEEVAVATAPAAEIVFVPSLPARVISAPPAVGTVVTGVLLELGSGALQAQLSLAPAQRQLVQAHQPITFTSDDGSLGATGNVTSVGNSVQTAFDGSTAYLAAATVDTDSVDIAGQEVQAVVTVQESDEEVLYVPQAAVVTGADGQTYVDRTATAFATGSRERVRVSLGLATGGNVAVTAPDLSVGDFVVVDQPG